MPKSFYIIDGHAQIYRAYFAPFRDLTSPSGEPTKATFVFTQMLLTLIEQRRPDYLAMVIDSGEEAVFRKAIYPEYKANRKHRPDDFTPQEERILQIVRDAGVPIFFQPGFEADDVIATMARQLCDQDYDIFLVSKDKDLRQLVNHCTRMYDVQSDQVIDAATMEAESGYSPAEAVEIQTLTGDSTDNVPGIPGVGEKTAAKLIKKYGRADEVLKHLDELTPKLRESFEKHADNLPRARQLVTLRNDVEMTFDPEQCRFTGLNLPALRPHLEGLGFYTLLKRLGLDGAPPAPVSRLAPRSTQRGVEQGLFGAMGEEKREQTPLQTSADCDYHLVDTEEKFVDFLRQLKKAKRFAFDTETDALGAMNSNLIGMSFSWQPTTGWYVPVKGPAGSQHLALERVLKDLKPILESEKIEKVGHNLKYDLLVMRRVGVQMHGVAMDSMIAAFLIDSGRFQYGIDQLARDLFNFRKIPTTDLIGSGKKQISMVHVDLEKVAAYASEDADIALRLSEYFRPKLEEVPEIKRLHDELETPLIDVLAEMEFNGVAIDPAILKEQSQVLSQRVDELRKRIHESADCTFNIDSPKQLGEVLFNRLGLRVVKRTKTGPSTDVEVLDKLALEHECPRLILEYRSLVKLKNTYLDNLSDYVNPQTGRIHGSFNQTGAATGRLSMSDPNLQNIPIRTDEGRRIRLAFVPGDPKNNVLLTADYSQIELRMLAHFTQEPALLQAFAADEDIHRAVAAEVFSVPLDQVTREQRGQAKTINFGIIYGVSAYGLARRIEGLSVEAAGQLITAYNQRFPSIARFLDQCVMAARSQGYVTTLLGRRRYLPDINSSIVAMRNAAERMAINSVVQGSAADLIKIAMLTLHRRLAAEQHPSKMLLQVHDELIFETPKAQAESEAEVIRQEMIQAGPAMKLTVPLKVGVGWGPNWQEGK